MRHKDFKDDVKIIESYLRLRSYRKVSRELSYSISLICFVLKRNKIEIIPYKYTKEERKCCSERNKNLWQDENYRLRISNLHLGKKQSEETKIKRSISLKNNLPRTVFKIGNIPHHKGKTKQNYDPLRILGERTRATRISRNNYAHTPSQDFKISMALKGKPKSPEHIKKVAEANRGKKYSKEEYPYWGWRTSRKNQVFPVKDTSIEVKIQNFLKELKIEFFTHQYMHIEHGYQCDILIPSLNFVIECDGDYWHKYPIGNDIDHIRTRELLEKGFRVLRLWGFEIRKMDLDEFRERLNL